MSPVYLFLLSGHGQTFLLIKNQIYLERNLDLMETFFEDNKVFSKDPKDFLFQTLELHYQNLE